MYPHAPVSPRLSLDGARTARRGYIANASMIDDRWAVGPVGSTRVTSRSYHQARRRRTHLDDAILTWTTIYLRDNDVPTRRRLTRCTVLYEETLAGPDVDGRALP